MNHLSTLVGATLAGLLFGCASAESKSNTPNDSFASAWVEVAATQFQDNGETSTVTISVPDARPGIALQATTAPGVCFQLSSVQDGAGHSVISGRSAGAFCQDCDLRTSLAVESGVFVLPKESGVFEPDTGLSLRFARLDCLTLTPLTTPDDRPDLTIAAQPLKTTSELAHIDLRLFIADSSILFGDEERQRELIDVLGQELASAGIAPRLLETRYLEGMPAEIRFHAGDQASLAALVADAPPKAETTIDVFFGGCLLYDDPIFGPPNPVHGYTPRILGGAGPADAVFLRGLDCFALDAGPIDIPIGLQARILAHELGHYLGVYHVIETDGTADQFDDTSSENIMHPNPEQAKAIGFSPSQGRSMRMHPSAHVD